MKKISSLFLSFTLLALSAGQAPYAAAAGNIGAKGGTFAGTPAISIAPAAGAGASFALPSTTLGTPSFSVNAGLTLPGSSIAGAGAAGKAAGAAFAQADTANAAASAKTGLPTAAAGKANAAQAEKASVTAAGQLEAGAHAILPAASAAGSSETGSASLDRVFSGSARKTSAGDAAVAAQDGKGFSPLGKPAAGQNNGHAGPPAAWGDPTPAPDQPKQSLGRSANVGLITAVVPMLLTMATVIIAQLLGYQFDSNYGNPLGTISAGAALVAATVMAPISEEIIFRGGIMGWFKKLFGRIPKVGAFWLPAALSSAIFVAVHETSDPVLFSTRFVHSMIISYAYHKEGYTGSIFSHAFFNGLAVAGMVLPALLGPVGVILTALTWPIAIGFSIRAMKKLRAQREDKASGKLVAYEVNWKLAAAFAAILAAGFGLLMANQVWAVGALAWAWYAYKKWKASRAL
jgi:membrane protease YdiL (CAAX protease family)